MHQNRYINYIKKVNRLHQNKIHKLILLRQKQTMGRLNTYCLLYCYGIHGIPFKWFKCGIPFTWFENYLFNRTQFVMIGNTILSNCETITCGIPQGSTLGPLLFLLYINDLPNCSNKLSFRIFADGTNVFYTSANLQYLESVMNDELKLVFKYCTTNKLSINLRQTIW